MKKLKNFLIFILLVLLASCIGTACGKGAGDGANQEQIIEIGTLGLEYELNGEGTGYRVSMSEGCTETEIVIPSYYNDLPVLEIADSAFKESNIVSVEIGYNVTEIRNYAFKNCELLTDVIMPDTITHVEYSSFGGCKSLKK